jgi:DNA-binding transcriptional MocR family regulator
MSNVFTGSTPKKLCRSGTRVQNARCRQSSARINVHQRVQKRLGSQRMHAFACRLTGDELPVRPAGCGGVCGRQARFVCAIGEVEQPVRAELTQPIKPKPAPPPPGPPKIRAFEFGRPDMRLFPYRQWARAMVRAAGNSPEALATSPDRFGGPTLRQALAKHLAE